MQAREIEIESISVEADTNGSRIHTEHQFSFFVKSVPKTQKFFPNSKKMNQEAKKAAEILEGLSDNPVNRNIGTHA